MFFIIGFVMAAVGFAMLVVGQFPLGKRQVKSRPSRWAGGIWVSYLPLAFGASFLLKQLELEETIQPAVIYGILLAICLLTGTIIVLRSAFGGARRPRTPAAGAGRTPFEPVGPPAIAEQGFSGGSDNFFSSLPPPPASPTPRKPGRRPAPPQKNPFDFS